MCVRVWQRLNAVAFRLTGGCMFGCAACAWLVGWRFAHSGAVGNVATPEPQGHGYTHGDSNLTAKTTLAAGMDNDCGRYFGTDDGPLAEAISSGYVPKETWYAPVRTRRLMRRPRLDSACNLPPLFDWSLQVSRKLMSCHAMPCRVVRVRAGWRRMTSLKNLFRVQMRLGMFDPDAAQPFRSYGLEKVDTPEHRELTLDAARQGMTLVKNENKALPLAKKTNLGIALVGPNAVSTHRARSALCFRTVDAENISRRAAEILLSDRLHLF